MLNNLRKSAAGGWAAKILIGLLVLAFATWGIADIFTPNPNAALATVGDEEVTPYELERRRRQMQRSQRGMTPEIVRALSGALLRQLVQEKLLNVHAKALGLAVPEENIRKAIADDRNFQGIRGEFSADAFRRYLGATGQSEAAFVENLRKEMLRRQLLSFLGAEIKVPQSLIQAQHRFDNNKRILEFITVTKANIEKIKPADEAQLKDYYDRYKGSLYKAPEYRQVAYIYLSADEMKKDFKVAPEKVKEFYEKNKSRFITSKERRHVKQISFKDMKTAEAAHKELSSGKKFADIAKKYGKNKAINDLGLKQKSQLLDKKVAEVAFSTAKGKFSKPVKTIFQAAVIVLVDKIEPQVVTPFNKVEKEIADRFAGRDARKKLTSLAKAIENDRAEGVEMKKIAEKHKVQYREAWVDAKGNGLDGAKLKDFPSSPKLLKEIYDSDKGLDNDQVDIDRTQVAWFDVLELKPERVKPYKEVKDLVAKSWLLDAERKAVRKKASDLLKELKKGGKLADVAKKLSLKVQKTKAVKRSETPKGVTSATVKQAFTLAKNQFGMSLGAKNDSRILFQVTDVQQAPKLDDKRIKELQTRLSRSLIQDMGEQYVKGLEPEFDLEYNDAAVQREIGRSSANL